MGEFKIGEGIPWMQLFNIPKINGISINQQTPIVLKPQIDISALDLSINKALKSFNKQLFINGVKSYGVQELMGKLTGKLPEIFGDSEVGRTIGNVFSGGLETAGSTILDNYIKGNSLSAGLGQNVGASLQGAAVGIGSNLVGKGITSLMGDSKLGKFTGATTASALGLFLGGGIGNPMVMAGNALGSGLSAMTGPSKEYNGKYGNITKTLDSTYGAIQGTIGMMGPAGAAIAAGMALNKGLSNIFGSTSGMTRQDAILGSAFMPAPVKWLNMAGAKTTGTFNDLSWLNTEKTLSFMQNAFGNLQSKFDLAGEEAGKTYGTFSRKAYSKAQDNLNFANTAWNKVLTMADLNELQKIRSEYMTSINNLRYAQNIQGGFSPIYRGKQGMKMFNNATNHNIGQRLLSGAALIDNKQVILCSVVN